MGLYKCQQINSKIQAISAQQVDNIHIDDLKTIKQQLEQAKKAEEEARHQREELELKMLQHTQQMARQRQLDLQKSREEALDKWKVQSTDNNIIFGEDSDTSSVDTVAISPMGTTSNKNTSTKIRKSKKNKKKWSQFAVTKPSQSIQNPAPAQGSRQNDVTLANAVPATFQNSTIPQTNINLSIDSLGSLEEVVDPLQQAYASGLTTSDDICVLPKPIFVVSDCTGESAAHTVRCALGQFEQFMKATCPANLVIFRFLDSERKAFEVLEKAAQEDALVVYTLVDNYMVKALRTAAQLHNVQTVDLWGPLLDSMEQHLETHRSGIPFGSQQRRPKLSPDYFKMIAAVEYTRKMDDGANPSKWIEADLVILGVSRSGKTPLSIYLGQRGYKTANLPLVAGIPPPKELYEIDQRKVVGLVIDPQVLSSIRTSRKSVMGVEHDEQLSYAQITKVKEELAWAKELYSANPQWPVLDVTFRGVEETAARILRIMSERLGDVHPMWSQAKTL